MEDDYGYELLPTAFPAECDVSDKNLANVEFLYANKIIGWPNFTHCLPSCGLCTSFASDQTYLHYNLIVIGILLPFISVCGLFGNGLSAFLYSRRMLSTSTNIYLCALGVSDCGVIITAIFLFFIDSVRRYSLTLTRGFGMFSPVVYPAGMLAQTASVYFTLAAATDCFVRVVAPERWRAVIGRRKFYLTVIVGVLIWSILYNLPHFFEAVLLHCWHTGFDDWSVEVCPEPFRFNPTYITVYYSYMYSMFLAVGPLVVLIGLNVVIILSSFVIRNKGGADAGENVALVLVVLLFISCNTIALLINIFETRLSLALGWRINYIIDISNLLVVFNSSFNFVIYYNFSSAFRTTFHHYFGGHKGDSQCKTVLIRDSSGNAPILVTSTTFTPALEREIVLRNNYANELDIPSPEDETTPRNSVTRLLSHSTSEVVI